MFNKIKTKVKVFVLTLLARTGLCTPVTPAFLENARIAAEKKLQERAELAASVNHSVSAMHARRVEKLKDAIAQQTRLVEKFACQGTDCIIAVKPAAPAATETN